LSPRHRAIAYWVLAFALLCLAPGVPAQDAETPAEATDAAQTSPATENADESTEDADDENAPRPWSFGRLMDDGGPMMWLLLLASIVALGFAVERAISLQRDRHLPPGLANQILSRVRDHGPADGVRASIDSRSSLGRLLAGGLRRTGTSRQEMVQGMLEESARLQYDIRRRTRVLGIIASIAPLLGLLGTVLGMIRAFDAVQQYGMGQRGQQLAGGISEALLTTGAGLTIAIPVYLVYQFFKGRGDDIVREGEEIAEAFLIEVSRPESRAAAVAAEASAETSDAAEDDRS
jgi:biopolymer transport protein ExbB